MAMIRIIQQYISLFLKGMGIGAANVIPGVSGGTIALLTGIFEKLIDSIKSFNIKAVKLFFQLKLKEFANHVNLDFLITVFLGVGVSIITIAKLLDRWFCNYPVLVWAYFFGLIVASVYFVGKTVSKWSLSVVVSFVIGTVIAVSISVFLDPAKENDSFYYLVICGIVAVCSMIIPGLSGSFVLILLGNYQLVMIKAVNDLDMGILLPVIAGAIAGLVAFSHFLSWIYKKYRDQTTSVLTGFILGSLSIIWPWKIVRDAISNNIINVGKFGSLADCTQKVYYDNPVLPKNYEELWYAVVLAIVGILSIVVLEKLVTVKSNK